MKDKGLNGRSAILHVIVSLILYFMAFVLYGIGASLMTGAHHSFVLYVDGFLGVFSVLLNLKIISDLL